MIELPSLPIYVICLSLIKNLAHVNYNQITSLIRQRIYQNQNLKIVAITFLKVLENVATMAVFSLYPIKKEKLKQIVFFQQKIGIIEAL